MVKFLNRDMDSAIEKMSIIRLFTKGTTHQHSYYELTYVLQGFATRITPDAKHTVKAGDFYLMPPLHVHGYADQQNFEIFSCLFMPECVDRTILNAPVVLSSTPNRILRLGMLEDLPIFDKIFHDSDGTVRTIIKRMEQEYADCQSGYIEMLGCLLLQILIYAYRTCQIRSPHRAVEQVIEFLKVHYAETVSLHTLSRLIGYTPQYLSSLFSQDVGMSIQSCLQRIRIEEACTLLSHTNMTTAEISEAVGYQDVRYFSKIFNRYMKISPKKYRITQSVCPCPSEETGM